jgi:hypothetical protein
LKFLHPFLNDLRTTNQNFKTPTTNQYKTTLIGENVQKNKKMSKTLKTIQKIFRADELLEGGGFKVNRGIGVSNLRNLDPFLMLE